MKRHILAIFLIAFSVRLLYFFEVKNIPSLSPDSAVYQNLSMKIVYGNSPLKEEFLPLSPPYVYFLAFLKNIFSKPLPPALLVQFAFGSAACIILFLCALSWFSRPVAFLSSLFAAFYPMNLFYEGQILPESFVFFFFCLFIFILSRFKSEKKTAFFTAGLSCAFLYFMTLSSVFLFPFTLASLVFTFKNKKQTIAKTTALLVSGFLFLYALMSFVFSSASNETFLPGVTTTGIHFYIGNNANAPGYFYDFTQKRRSMEHLSAIKSRESANAEAKKRLSSGEASLYWIKKTFASAGENMEILPRLVLTKAFLIVNNFEPPDNADYYFARTTSRVLKLLFLSFGILFPLCAMGVILCVMENKGKDKILLFLAAAAVLPLLLFYVTSRGKILLYPFLFMFSSHFIVWTFHTMRQSAALLFSPLLLLSSLYFLSNFKLPIHMASSKNLVNLAVEHIKKGEIDEALLDLQTALEFDPKLAPAHYNVGVALARKGNIDKAVQSLRLALEYDENYMEAYYALCRAQGIKKQYSDALNSCKKANEVQKTAKTFVELGILYGELHRIDESIWALEKAVEMEPRSAEARFNLALAYARKKLLDPAIEQAKKALEVEEFADAYFLIGTLYQNTGDAQKAVSSLKKALELNPRSADAHAVLGNIYLAQKNKEQALNHFKKALELDPRNPIAKSQISKLN